MMQATEEIGPPAIQDWEITISYMGIGVTEQQSNKKTGKLPENTRRAEEKRGS